MSGPRMGPSALKDLRDRFADLDAGTGEWVRAGHELALALGEQFAVTEDLQDLDEAIAVAGMVALAVAEASEDRCIIEMNLSVDLSERFRRTGNKGDLDLSISLGRKVAGVCSDELRPAAQTNLAARLMSRYELQGDPGCTAEAIDLLRRAEHSLPVDHPDRAATLSNLGLAISAQYERVDDPADLTEAIQYTRAAIALFDGPARAGAAANLATQLLSVYEDRGDVAALHEAVAHARRAVAGSGNSAQLATRHHTLSQALGFLFETSNDIRYLEEAAEAMDMALADAEDRTVSTPIYLSTAASLAHTRYVHGKGRAELDLAIAYNERAMALLEPSQPTWWICANNDVIVRSERFAIDGNRVDLDTAIGVAEETLGAPLSGRYADVEPALLNNYVLALNTRFQLDEKLADLDEAIDAGRRAIDLTPRLSPHLPDRLMATGDALASRGVANGATADLNEAIDLGRRALSHSTLQTTDRHMHLTTTAGWLADRGRHTSSPKDLNQAIDMLRQAFALAPTESVDAARIEFNLANRLSDRYELGYSQDSIEDLQEAADLLDDVVGLGWPEPTMYAGQRLASIAVASGDWRACEAALGYALDAAIELTGIRLERYDKERARFGIQGAGGLAAYAAATIGKHEASAVHLEQASATLHAERLGLTADKVGFADIVAIAARIDAPIVYLCAVAGGGIATVVAPDGTCQSVLLPDASAECVAAAVTAVRDAFNAPGAGDPYARWSRACESLLQFTWQAAIEPIAALISSAPRIAFVPVGQMAWLPLTVARSASGDTLLGASVGTVLPNARTFIDEQAPPPGHLSAFVAHHPGPPARYLASVFAEASGVAAHYARHTAWGPTPTQSGTMDSLRRVRRQQGRSTAVPPGRVPRGLVEQIGRADIVHFACHLDLDFDEPLESAFVLDHAVLLRDLTAEGFKPGAHVVLGACDSGLTGTHLPDEAVGPSTVLIAAGAHSVCAALWPLDDQDAPEFLGAYHERLASGESPARALAETQLAFADRPPVVWAAFANNGSF